MVLISTEQSYTLRCGIIEVCGHLLAELTKDDREETHKSQIDSLYDLLEERFLDVNPYCRSRLMQVLCKICE
jgi:condensin complex subunit 1